MGGGCRHGVDSKSGKREGGFSDRASRDLLGEFGFGPKDTGRTNSSGQKIGGGDLLLPSSIRCSSRAGEFDRASESLGVGEVEKKKIWQSDGKRDWVQGGRGENSDFGFGILIRDLRRNKGEKVRRWEGVKVIEAGPKMCRRIGIVTGGFGDLDQVVRAGLDTLITGEADYPTEVKARELGLNLILGGHRETEVFGVKALAKLFFLRPIAGSDIALVGVEKVESA